MNVSLFCTVMADTVMFGLYKKVLRYRRLRSRNQITEETRFKLGKGSWLVKQTERVGKEIRARYDVNYSPILGEEWR